MKRLAKFSKCEKYRYWLIREWDKGEGSINIIMLNPSTADHKRDDPTISRCTRYAKSMGYRRLTVTNLFAYRATKQDKLYAFPKPIGRQNDAYLRMCSHNADLVICAWGNLKSQEAKERASWVISLLQTYGLVLYTFKQNGSGQPAHPLYLPAPLKARRLKWK